jgi:hypothetical protein
MVGAKRRQEEERDMRVNPENINIEDADGFVRTCRHHRGVVALAPRIFREHGLISRLQGKIWNRRGPAGPKRIRVV